MINIGFGFICLLLLLWITFVLYRVNIQDFSGSLMLLLKSGEIESLLLVLMIVKIYRTKIKADDHYVKGYRRIDILIES